MKLNIVPNMWFFVFKMAILVTSYFIAQIPWFYLFDVPQVLQCSNRLAFDTYEFTLICRKSNIMPNLWYSLYLNGSSCHVFYPSPRHGFIFLQC